MKTAQLRHRLAFVLAFVLSGTVGAALLALSVGDARAAGKGKAPKPEDEAIELYKQGVDFGNQGKLEEAIGAFQQATAKAPKRFDVAYLKLGLAYEMTHRWPEALACYVTAIEIDKKKKPDAHGFLGNLYRKMGLFQLAVDAHREAVDRAEKTLQKKPEKVADFHYDLGLDYMEMKLFGDAIRVFEKALELDPTKKQYGVMLANAFALNDKLDEAEAQYRKVLAADAKEADAMYGLGFIERKRGNKDAAKDWFKKACAEGHTKACRETKERYKALQ